MHNTLSSDAKRISIIKLGLFTHRNSYMVIYTETCIEQKLKENRGINYLLSEEPPFWLRNERKRGELTSQIILSTVRLLLAFTETLVFLLRPLRQLRTRAMVAFIVLQKNAFQLSVYQLLGSLSYNFLLYMGFFLERQAHISAF